VASQLLKEGEADLFVLGVGKGRTEKKRENRLLGRKGQEGIEK